MNKEIQELLEKQQKLIEIGNELFDNALFVTREYDGLHRLGSAAAKWLDTISKIHLTNK